MTPIQLEREQVSCIARMRGASIAGVLGLEEEARPSPSSVEVIDRFARVP